ncbi:MAG: VOC family protein [Ferruginibacter sp.]
MKKLLLPLLLCLITGATRAQETNAYKLVLNHAALSVKDVDRSALFYKNILGLDEITNKTKMEGIRWFSLGDGKELHLISIIKKEVIINKAVHLALSCTNFDAFIRSLEKNNIVYSDWPGTKGKVNVRADGIKQVFFQDPDGYWIEVNSVAAP